jgi:hypothetical protein
MYCCRTVLVTKVSKKISVDHRVYKNTYDSTSLDHLYLIADVHEVESVLHPCTRREFNFVNFYKDHGREPVGMVDLVARVHKGLLVEASLASISPTLIRVSLPAKFVLLALVRTKVVRLYIQQLGTTDEDRVATSMCRYQCIVSFLLPRWCIDCVPYW